MGNDLSQIDDGFFICGVDALEDVERLKEKKITFILNVAKRDLYYRLPPSGWDCEFCKFTSGSFDAVVDHEKSCSSNPEVVAAAKLKAGVAATTEAKAKAEAPWGEDGGSGGSSGGGGSGGSGGSSGGGGSCRSSGGGSATTDRVHAKWKSFCIEGSDLDTVNRAVRDWIGITTAGAAGAARVTKEVLETELGKGAFVGGYPAWLCHVLSL